MHENLIVSLVLQFELIFASTPPYRLSTFSKAKNGLYNECWNT